MTAPVVLGSCETQFARVADAFTKAIDAGGGASAVVYVDGRKVVDLHGGTADDTNNRPWRQDTITLVFSVTKGLAALCAHILVRQGALDLDAPVARYWPEYAAEGKQDTTVRHVLSHRAGVPVIDALLQPQDLAAWSPITRALEVQRPLWRPGTAYGYHALTFGHLVGELIRRVTGFGLADFFSRTVAGPLNADAWIGLPESEEARVAPQRPAASAELSADEMQLLQPYLAEGSLVDRSMKMGGALPTGLSLEGPYGFNSRHMRAVELPAGNGVMSADGLARIYASTVSDVDGIRLLDADTVKQALTIESSGPAADGFLDFGVPFSQGFQVGGGARRPMLGRSSFGHDGAGGSLGFADVNDAVGFGFITSQMGGLHDDRANSLCAALRRCLDA